MQIRIQQIKVNNDVDVLEQINSTNLLHSDWFQDSVVTMDLWIYALFYLILSL